MPTKRTTSRKAEDPERSVQRGHDSQETAAAGHGDAGHPYGLAIEIPPEGSREDKITIQLPGSSRFYVNYFVVPAAMLAAVFTAYHLRQVFLLFVISFFFAYILNPLVIYIERLFKNKALSILSVYLVLFSLFLLLVVPAATNIISEISDLGVKMQRYSNTFKGIYKSAIDYVEKSDSTGMLSELKTLFLSQAPPLNGPEAPTAEAGLTQQPPQTVPQAHYETVRWPASDTSETIIKNDTSEITLSYISKIHKLLRNNPRVEAFIIGTFDVIKDYLTDISLAILYGLMSFTIALIHYALVPVLSFYFLEDFKNLWNGFCHKIPSPHRKKIVSIIEEIDQVLGMFLRGQLIVCLVVGTGFSFALFFIGVDFAFIIGPIAGIFNIIPYLGPMVALVPSIVIAILKWGLTDTMVLRAMLIALSILVIHLFDAFGMQPFIADKSFNMHPLTLMLLLFIGLKAYGILGMFLAIPIYGVGKVIYKEFRIIYDPS